MKQRQFETHELADQPIQSGEYFGTTTVNNSYMVWHLEGLAFCRIGTVNPPKIALEQGQILRDVLAALVPFNESQFVVHRMTLPPGGYYPRMARPSDQRPTEAPGLGKGYSKDEAIESLAQMRSLVEMVNSIFGTVHASGANFGCFGAAIRNLLILACTECEAQWRGILSANGYPNPKATSDYVKLLPALRLDEYEVSLRHYPSLPAVAPFRGWNNGLPTQSLCWYDAYNATKHDRALNFPRATLGTAYQACCAVWILIIAQYGAIVMQEFEDLNNFFKLEAGPLWRYSDVYTYPYDGFVADAGPRYYPF